MRRTKIVCTLGPAVDGLDNLTRLIHAGMDVARFNFSHGTHEQHAARFAELRAASEAVGKPVAVLQDLCGPKIRLGVVEAGVVLVAGDEVSLSSEEFVGSATRLPLPIPELIAALSIGDRLLLDDGLLELRVSAVRSQSEVVCTVVSGGPISTKKGVAAPDVTIPIQAITEKDIADVRFGLELGVDFVALSFVRHADDVRQLRAIMQVVGRKAPILVKIEKREAVENLEAILAISDGAMVARGDLGVEMPIEEIARVQKHVIRTCNRLGKVVITATQMLDSMIRNPRPTRAEVTDIANAILDGTDALMLSGETAAGAYPLEAVATMSRIAQVTEAGLDFTKILREKQALFGTESVTDAVADAAVTIAHDQSAAAILCATETGHTARSVAKFRPATPIIALTPSLETQRRLALVWGVQSYCIPTPADTDQLFRASVAEAVRRGVVHEKERIVLTAGTPVGRAGSTNVIKVHHIGDPL